MKRVIRLLSQSRGGHVLSLFAIFIVAAGALAGLQTKPQAAHAAATNYHVSGVVVYNGNPSASGFLWGRPLTDCFVGIDTTDAGGHHYSGNPLNGGANFNGNSVTFVNPTNPMSCPWGNMTFDHSSFCINHSWDGCTEAGVSNTYTGNQSHRSTLSSRSVTDPGTNGWLDFRFFFNGPQPPSGYTVNGAVFDTNGSLVPNGCINVSVNGTPSTQNIFGVSAQYGAPSITADPSKVCGGVTYTLVGSGLCYNHNIYSGSTYTCNDAATAGSHVSIQDPQGWPHWSTGSTRSPDDPNTHSPTGTPWINMAWVYDTSTPAYTVTATRVQNGAGNFPSGNGSITTVRSDTGVNGPDGNNPSSFSNVQGLAHIYSRSIFTDPGGTVFALVGLTGKNGGVYSSLCYNHAVVGCSSPSTATLADLDPADTTYARNPADPTTLPGGPPKTIDSQFYYEKACSTFTVYGMDDTQTGDDYAAVKAANPSAPAFNPLNGPPQGTRADGSSWPSRAHVATTITGSFSGSAGSGCNGRMDPNQYPGDPNTGSVSTAFPTSTTTHNCAYGTTGTPGCYRERQIYIPPADYNAGKASLTAPPTTTSSTGRVLTYVGASYEDSSGAGHSFGGNFPTPVQGSYRLIYHYVDCTDTNVSFLCTGGTPTPNPPTCSNFTANPSSFPVGGGISNLTWSTSNATSASLNPGGSVPVNGPATVNVGVTTTVTLTVSGPGGSPAQCTLLITVGTGGGTPGVTCTSDPDGSPPEGTVGQQFTFTAGGGTGAFHWTLTDGGTADSSVDGNPFQAHFDTPRPVSGGGYNIDVTDSAGSSTTCTVYINPAPPTLSYTVGCSPAFNYDLHGVAYNASDPSPIDVDIVDVVNGKTTVTLATGKLANDPSPSGGTGGNHGLNFTGPVADSLPTTTHSVTVTAYGSSTVSHTEPTFTCPKPPVKNAPAQLFFPEYLGERPPLY